VFIFNSQDQYIYRILQYWGWSQNNVNDSPLFNLKWTYNDSPADYNRLTSGQILNHFKNNQQMTSKGCLTVNLKQRKNISNVPVSNYFPKCFDLGNPTDQTEFRE
jgi:hypothetical protein